MYKSSAWQATAFVISEIAIHAYVQWDVRSGFFDAVTHLHGPQPDMDMIEACCKQHLMQLRDGPQPPMILEGSSQILQHEFRSASEVHLSWQYNCLQALPSQC